MSGETCRTCGKPLPSRTGRRGRASVYCSAACRQRAYRERRTPDSGVTELIADVAERAGRLTARPPERFYADVTELSSAVGRLRRIARTARSGAESVTRPAVTEKAAPDHPAEADFAGRLEGHRRELQAHCYRMTGSYDESEDLVQEAFLKAWRARESYDERAASLRTWLYRIATNTCLDHLRRHSRTPTRYERIPGMEHGDADPPAFITWLQPCPDELLADVPDAAADPEAQAVARETGDLVFLAALQYLPPRQRAALVLRDVVGLPAAETAELLELSTAAVNSALQRARPTLREHLPAGSDGRLDWSAAEFGPQERAAVERYRAAAANLDMAAMAALLTEDAKLTMPPNPFWFVGRQAILDFVGASLDPVLPTFFGEWRHVETRANGRPAVAGYVKRPGTTVFRAQTLEVLRVEDGRIAEITTFEPHLLPVFGLPMTL
ncbi:sigma-70 family RNA polymerase sigma factor [Streptomyces sp. A7024]|uniref:RNA polymerase sigma factor n=1 Tax=Streptomyces coryli TaxID=1128680 RepID=A0A6G4UAB5_9ACTN|nr:RNA polymerase subunit sigma-70 [Streptomyces coryli]NGN69185.1 sigma-70 family RNA polymerase sigma factor [Streptomyces coryli]